MIWISKSKKSFQIIFSRKNTKHWLTIGTNSNSYISVNHPAPKIQSRLIRAGIRPLETSDPSNGNSSWKSNKQSYKVSSRHSQGNSQSRIRISRVSMFPLLEVVFNYKVSSMISNRKKSLQRGISWKENHRQELSIRISRKERRLLRSRRWLQ